MEQLVLYEGRPADCTGRLEKEVRTYDFLDKLGIHYWRTDHAWMKADTMEDCHIIDACLNATVCKNLFLCNRQKTNFYLLMMPGNKPFKTKELSHQLGIARLSFLHHGTDERPGEPCAAAAGQGCESRGVHRVPPLHQYVLAQTVHERYF